MELTFQIHSAISVRFERVKARRTASQFRQWNKEGYGKQSRSNRYFSKSFAIFFVNDHPSIHTHTHIDIYTQYDTLPISILWKQGPIFSDSIYWGQNNIADICRHSCKKHIYSDTKFIAFVLSGLWAQYVNLASTILVWYQTGDRLLPEYYHNFVNL